METHKSADYERGKQQCACDISSGHPKLYWDYRGRWGELLVRLMRERFGVTVEYISDIRSEEQDAFWSGNHDALSEYVNSAYGAGAFQGVQDEIWQFRKDQYQRWLASQKGPAK